MFRIFFIVSILLLAARVGFGMERLNYTAPSQLPHTTQPMKTAGYWVGRSPHPDQIILHADEINRFNLRIQNDLKLTKDILSFPTKINGEEFRKKLKESLEEIKGKGYRRFDGRKLQESCLSKDVERDECAPRGEFFIPVEKNINLDAIPKEIDPRFGFIVHYADQRFLPTDEILTEEPRDVDFDELQNSALDIGTAVAVLHESKDGQWFYVESSESFGWVKKENVAMCELNQLKDYFLKPDRAVVIAAKADIFLDEQRTNHLNYVQMGASFPLVKTDEVITQVQIPIRDEKGNVNFKLAYLNSEDVHRGYLSYTPRNVIKQAFKLLNAPYGWGGMYGEQDCSRFLQEIFSTFGIYLPRDSKDQAKVGEAIAEFSDATNPLDKLAALRRTEAGISILPLKGHIMLYLGMVDGRPYAIHATWGYRQKMENDDVVRVLNRVVVSDLSLGEGSKKGSLLERLKSIRTLR